MLWYDLKFLLNEKPFGEIPKLNIDLDYSFRPFQDVEKEYLELFCRFSENETPKQEVKKQ